MNTNTQFIYQYRDAANYKVFDIVIIRGVFSLFDIEEYLYEKDFFVPSEIGLKDLQPKKLTHDDHIWHAIFEISYTKEKPTVNISAEEIVLNFNRAFSEEWNILEASKRLGLLV
ncbi:MAG: hypothetical protein MAG551_02638 [Candidatus Scalindua arabica]|uniref:Uncharacterized protein n=1 Tax=Candidatus Scalindua arabica TaxID=1127984 RepID=A0A941W530_9BACT|nr:hypothetical protein [Candidatus Scalindua arabica]